MYLLACHVSVPQEIQAFAVEFLYHLSSANQLLMFVGFTQFLVLDLTLFQCIKIMSTLIYSTLSL